MARNFEELRNKMRPEAQALAKAQADAVLEKMALHELRRERRKTQADVAAYMRVGQGAVSKIEQRGTLSLGALKRYVGSLGGELEISARFPDKRVELAVHGDE